MNKIHYLRDIAEIEYSNYVKTSFFLENKLRLILTDNSLIDINISQKIDGKFGYHWERQDGSIYRYDNVPDSNWKNVESFPYHFHNTSYNNVESSTFPQNIEHGFRGFMDFVIQKLAE